MRGKIFLAALFFLVVMSGIGIVSADLGSFPMGSCVLLKSLPGLQDVNISTISYPNGTIAASNIPMILVDQTGTYNFCLTQTLGPYIYDYYDASGNRYVNKFDIGDSNGFWITLILGIAGFIIFLIGYIIKNEYFGYISGMVFMTLGVYGIINGFGFVNNVYTNAIAYTALGLGLIMFVAAIFASLSGEGDSEED